MEKVQLKAFTAWKIAHRRWDEENSVFHWLKTFHSGGGKGVLYHI